ncbi:MAG TPA: glycoside hydrolase family 97 catalytic domain-containing protein [Kiritimatiellia bacterium]|nr:glycoside hydrolase family 97 catalytic domain-containing protein [Kiritimatiellia bacterium]HRU70783.1 glycoside hydrolase family 97 catalytic domain-containing protein [Kiritimatiellia bacterium]
MATVLRAEIEQLQLTSQSGAVHARFTVDESGWLTYRAWYRGQEILAPAPLGISVAGCNLGQVTAFKPIRIHRTDDRFPVRGVQQESRLAAQRALCFVQPVSGPSYGLQALVSDSGIAWRFVIPGKGVRRINGETACWRLPPESRIWFAERRSDWKLKTYAGEWLCTSLTNLYAVSPQGPIQTMPLVAELPDGHGYAAIVEAALFRYSGMRLSAEPDGTLRGCFTEASGFEVDGPIQTPWRVLLLAPTLNAWVNNDLIAQLAPPPDPELFDSEAWITGGRSVWSWWQGRDDYMQPEAEKQMIDAAAALNFEFTTIDEGWEKWTNAWSVLTELCDYARARSVRVFVWKHSREIRQPESDYSALREFLDQVKQAGAAGVKIDFMNSESYDTILFDERVLIEAARRRLLVNFHGCQKPSGEARTYPNEVTREGIRGLELNRIAEHARQRRGSAKAPPYVPGGENQDLPASHNAALPFTRCIAGHADYTPLAFSRPGNTTWTHQLALAYLITSPLLVMAEHPQRLLADPELSPALPFVRELPVCWDETRVLEGSRIGELAAFARRKGNTWFVAMVNGTDGLKMVSIDLSFTGWREVAITELADRADTPTAFAPHARTTTAHAPFIVTLQPCGGYVAKVVNAER